MNPVSNYAPSPSDCYISAWIAPGHAFVDFNCGEMLSQTVGYYPDLEYLGLSAADDLPLSTIASSSLGLGAKGGLSWHAGSFIHSIHGGKGLFFSSAASQVAATVFSLGNSLLNRGEFLDDSEHLESCLSGEVPCMVKHFNVTRQAAEKAWKLKLLIEEEIEADEEELCQLEPTGWLKYSIVGNNCVDFMLDTMKFIGDSNPRQGFSYTYPPTFIDRVTALAWHYFNWV